MQRFSLQETVARAQLSITVSVDEDTFALARLRQVSFHVPAEKL